MITLKLKIQCPFVKYQGGFVSIDGILSHSDMTEGTGPLATTIHDVQDKISS